jgi:hypothetical protein
MWLSGVPIGIGMGVCGGDCYLELPRIPIPRTSVNEARKRSGLLHPDPS